MITIAFGLVTAAFFVSILAALVAGVAEVGSVA
jgi:hypothetical protein